MTKKLVQSITGIDREIIDDRGVVRSPTPEIEAGVISGFLTTTGNNKLIRGQGNLCECICVCKKIVWIRGSIFLKNIRTSCGCKGILDRPKPGDRYGMWTVLKYIKKNNRTAILCRCECGTESEIISHLLRKGKSEGCLPCRTGWLPYGIAARNLVLSKYKLNAKRRDLIFEISDNLAFKLFEQPCFYCGFEKSNCVTLKSGSYKYNGIDRKDSCLGYLESNVVPCCGPCNRAKLDMPFKEWVEWLDRIAKFRGEAS